MQRWQDLDESVKATISEREWLFLTEDGQRRFLNQQTEPEEEEFIDG